MRSVSLAAVAATLFLVTGSCAIIPGGSLSDVPRDSAGDSAVFDEVTYEEMDQRILEALERVRERLAREVGSQWSSGIPKPKTGVCPGGMFGRYRLGDFTGPIPDDRWETAQQLLMEEFAPLGATELIVLRDEPGRHVIDIVGEYGFMVSLGSAELADLIVFGPCIAER
ncbi:MAG: hypothetical protein CSA84_00825 [Actinomycetales bacterium]|nr:MAG: hypothetical protein CSA84_00825 [Actinomycetales bacterium]